MEYRGEQRTGGRRFAIVAARFNPHVTEPLVEGALGCFHASGAAEDDVDVAWVPGAFELPLVARRLAGSGVYEGVVCIGAVIRGETAHFDHVAREAARGIADAARDTGVPVIFGVLTTDTLEQATDRAGGRHGNKGWEAAQAALETASLLDRLPKQEG
ncbi:MAG: 6,7-dimethyl-8-ribityllumazine synthase [Actinomycetota bacterium]